VVLVGGFDTFEMDLTRVVFVCISVALIDVFFALRSVLSYLFCMFLMALAMMLRLHVCAVCSRRISRLACKGFALCSIVACVCLIYGSNSTLLSLWSLSMRSSIKPRLRWTACTKSDSFFGFLLDVKVEL